MSQQAQSQPARADLRVSWILFWSTLAFTAFATWFVVTLSRETERSVFQREADVLDLHVQYRLQAYESLLRSGAALFAASQEVSEKEFGRFVTRLRLEEVFPGLQGMGFSVLVPETSRASILAEARKWDPTYRFYPETPPGEELHAILYLQPHDVLNRWAIGFNMHSQPLRRKAMDEARDSGRARASGCVQLVQHKGQPGFLVYVPVYSAALMVPKTVEERREKLVGFVYGAFQVHDFFSAALRQLNASHLDVEVYESDAGGPELQIFNSLPIRGRDARLSVDKSIDVAGHLWTVRISGKPKLGLASPAIIGPLVAGIGLSLAGLLFWMTRGMALAKADAQESAVKAARNQQLFERIASATPDILFVHDMHNHRNIFVNRQVAVILGYTPEQVKEMGARWGLMVHPDDREEMTRFRSRVAELVDGDIAKIEVRALHADGSYRWMLVRTLIFTREQDGKPIEALGMATDISERRAYEEALRSANTAKDEFLATLSHELRTPLTPVLAIISTLQHDDRLADDVREELTIARRNVELEARLIDDLLDLTRIVRGKLSLNPEVVDMKEVAEHTVSSVVELAERKIDFAIEWNASNRWIRGDRSRLTQVLWNVLKNAAKFTPPGNQVRLRAHNETGQDKRERLVIEIVDTGVGIDPDNLRRIFNAFEQGGTRITRRFGGLGLGLAISKAIAEMHGGEIAAFSEGLGHGARFELRFPTVSAPADLPGSSSTLSTSSNGNGTGMRLLLVEDHPDTAEILTKRLRRSGYRVGHASSVAEAVSMAGQAAGASDPFKFVLSDLGLPDGTGYDLMRQLKDQHGLRGVALSGFGMDADIKRSQEAGFLRHFTKPVDMEVLKKALSEMLETD